MTTPPTTPASADATPTDASRDWPESKAYIGLCRSCHRPYFGPKPRIQARICRQCSESKAPPVVTPDTVNTRPSQDYLQPTLDSTPTPRTDAFTAKIRGEYYPHALGTPYPKAVEERSKLERENAALVTALEEITGYLADYMANESDPTVKLPKIRVMNAASEKSVAIIAAAKGANQ